MAAADGEKLAAGVGIGMTGHFLSRFEKNARPRQLRDELVTLKLVTLNLEVKLFELVVCVQNLSGRHRLA